MNSDAGRTALVAALAGMLGVALLSSFAGLLWNQDALYLLNFAALLWAAAGTRIAWLSRGRSVAIILNLFALTMYAGRTFAGVTYGIQNWLGLHENPLSGVLLGANYLAHFAIAILAYRAAPREQRHPIRRLLGTSAIVLLLAVAFLSMIGEEPLTSLVKRYPVSPTLVYEKWHVDYGGTGGDDCQVFRIRTLGLVARYQQIDPDHGAAPEPIAGGCGL